MVTSPDEYGFYEISVKEVLDKTIEISEEARPDFGWNELELAFAE